MNIWEAVVVIVLIGAVAGVLRTFLVHSHPRQPEPAPESVAAQDEIRQLKERIQVLERVITDNHGSSELGREIERLRDR